MNSYNFTYSFEIPQEKNTTAFSKKKLFLGHCSFLYLVI